MGSKRYRLGSDTTLLVATMSDKDTIPADWTRLPFYNSSVGGGNELGYESELGGGADAGDPYFDDDDVGGSIETRLDARRTGFWLARALGAPTTVDNTGTYTHTFKSGAAIPMIGFEYGDPELIVPSFDVVRGLKIGSVKHSAEKNGPGKISMDLVGCGEDRDEAASVDATPDSFVASPFSNSEGVIKVNGATVGAIVGGSFDFQQPLELIDSKSSANGEPVDVEVDERMATGTLVVTSGTDKTIDNIVSGKAPCTIAFEFTNSDGFTLKFTFARCFLPKPKRERAKGLMPQTFNWRASGDGVDALLKVELTNDVVNY